MGDPRRSQDSANTGKEKFGGKLTGRYTWPFSFSIHPISEAAGPSTASNTAILTLPQSFQERNVAVSVHYDLTLRISRGKLRADKK